MKNPTKKQIDDIVNRIVEIFRCFGGEKTTWGNPISIALQNSKPSFAAGVDVKEVVRFVIKQLKRNK